MDPTTSPKSIDASITAFIGVEGKNPIDIHLTISGKEQADVSIDIAIGEVDRRDEALDVLFCIARVSGLSHYSVEDNDVEMMVVSLSRNGDADGYLTLPAASQSPRYDLDQVSTSATAPKPQVAAFDPDSFVHPVTRLTKWNPGQEIRIFRPAAPFSMALVVGAVAAVIVSFMAYLFYPSTGVWGMLFVAATAFVIGAIGCRGYKHEYEVVLNWSLRTVSWRREWFARTANLNNIDHLELRGIEKVRHSGDDPYSTYLCKLELILDSGTRVFVVDNGTWEESDTGQRRQLEPLSAALAESIEKPWRWVPFQQLAVIRGLTYVGAVATLVGIFGGVGYLLHDEWAETRTDAKYSEMAMQVEATGAKVMRTGIYVGDENIFRDGFLITITDPKFDDDDLESLLERIDELPSYGLDLSGTKISDEAIKCFVGRRSVYLLIARGTDLTSDAVPAIAKTNIQCLDIRDTAIRLDDLKQWTNYDALKVLYISDNDITERDVRDAESVPYLDYILVNDEPTTIQMLTGLSWGRAGSETMTEDEKARYLEALSLEVASPPEFFEDHDY
ncbi:MAG: hypothetical protein O3C40_03280 [Planctomycetota bacterium]|nr:hypothetical protein [Planctomycetota bacterium]